MPCRATCSACCHGLFDVSAADAELLAQAVDALSPERAAALRARASAQLAACRERLPQWGPPHDVEALDEDVFDALCERLAQAPCPALGADGACEVYESRPATCRMTGLAMDGGAAGTLENVCPIAERFPRYAALAPVPFDLLGFEREALRCERDASARGYVSTTVAGALAAAGRP